MQNQKLIDGSIVEFQDDGRFGYIQRLGKRPSYGDAILVFPCLFDEPVVGSRLAELFNQESCYIVFFPLSAALRLKLCSIVGVGPCARPMPKAIRRKKSFQPNCPVASWFIDREDGTTDVVYQLSSEEENLALGEIWNDTMLIERLRSRWTPDKYLK